MIAIRKISLLFTMVFGLLAAAYPASLIADPGPKALKFSKSKKAGLYLPGVYLRIVCNTPGKEKKIVVGSLHFVTEDSLVIKTTKRPKNSKEKIAVSDILSVQKLHKKGRKGWKIVIGILVAMTIAGLIQINSIGAAFFLAAPVVALFTLVPYLIGNFLADLVSKKSVQKGWSFSTEDY